MAKFTVDPSELKNVLRMVEYDRVMCLEDGYDFAGLHLIVKSGELIILFDSTECEIEPWIIELEDDADECYYYNLEDWAVLELFETIEKAEDLNKIKIVIDTESEKLLVEKPEKTLEYKLW